MTSTLDVFFPNHTCLVCAGEINKSEHKFICETCADKLPVHENICDKCGCEVQMHAFVCNRCKNRTDGVKSTAKEQRKQNKSCWNFTKARSAFCYKSPIVELVLRFKYSAIGDVAEFAAPFLARTVSKHNMQADLIIPVPLAPKRAKQRGYNQAGLLAVQLSKITEVPVADDILVRIKETEAQKQMTQKQRRENLHGAFLVKPPYSAIKGKHILLVDDVFTTGATVDECARTLKKARPKSIEVLTIAGVNQYMCNQ